MKNNNWWQNKKIINLIIEKDSWIFPYVKKLQKKICKLNYVTKISHTYKDMPKGDLAFFLGCKKLCPKKYLSKNKLNLVVHESNLPTGRGFSPIQWQILKNKNIIRFCLIEAIEKVDAGNIYLYKDVEFLPTDLNKEIRKKQGLETINLCFDFLKLNLLPKPYKQTGKPTFYKRRNKHSSEINVNKSIKSQFNLLRVVDNIKYPAFFKLKNQIFKLKIMKLKKIKNEKH